MKSLIFYLCKHTNDKLIYSYMSCDLFFSILERNISYSLQINRLRSWVWESEMGEG